MNSHYYAPRFAKVANRFSKRNFQKLIIVIEADANNTELRITSKKHKILTKINYTERETYEDIEKYVLDTSEMKHETQQMFNKIKYGY